MKHRVVFSYRYNVVGEGKTLEEAIKNAQFQARQLPVDPEEGKIVHHNPQVRTREEEFRALPH